MSLILWIMSVLPARFYALSNTLDKAIVHHDGEVEEEDAGNPLGIIALGSIFDLVIFIPIGIYCWMSGNIPTADTFWPLFMNGATFTLGAWFFLECIRTEEASGATAIWQCVPVIGLVLAYYGLGESVGWLQILGIFLVVVGGFALVFSKKGINKRVLWMMLASSVMYAINDFVIAKYGREVIEAGTAFNLESAKTALPAIFADLFGKMFFGMIALVGRRERNCFRLATQEKLGMTASTCIVYAVGDMFYDIAKIFAPLALVQALCSTQPLFVFLDVITIIYVSRLILKRHMTKKVDSKIVRSWIMILHKFPKDIGEMSVAQKVFGIIMVVAGGILLSI